MFRKKGSGTNWVIDFLIQIGYNSHNMGKSKEELDREDWEHHQSNQRALDGADQETRDRKMAEEDQLMRDSRKGLE